MGKLFIPVIVGTDRPNRNSIKAAKFIQAVGSSFENIDTVLVDPVDFHSDVDGSKLISQDITYSDVTARADGFFIVTPEYNHSYPGCLKQLLDSEYDNYAHKAVALAGVSSGPWGGIRALESLVLTTRALGLYCTNTDVLFPRVKGLFDQDGKIIDDDYYKIAKKAWDELIWLAAALSKSRSKANSDAVQSLA